MKKKILVIGMGIIAVILIIVVVGISSSNKEVRLRNKIAAQEQVRESYFDKMWKIINQKAQVAEQYKDAFREIYPALIEGRYGDEKGGTLMKWITENNPSFDVSLYKDLMSSIEAERTGFFMEQKKLTDLAREHADVRTTLPSSIFVGGRPAIEVTVVSSDKTKTVMQQGKENDVELFKKDTQ